MISRTVYLCCYNSLQIYLWAQVIVKALFAAISVVTSHKSPSILFTYHSTILYAHWAQTLAWLELLHTVIGLAGAGVPTTFIQCLARYVVLIKVIEPIQTTHSSVVTLALLIVWALADVTRYGFYIHIAWKPPPYFLLWLRYSLFIILYPVGIICEWLTYWHTLDHVDRTQLYSISMPNAWNFAFHFGVWNRIVLVLYLYFGPFMFSHMLRQRHKKLTSS